MLATVSVCKCNSCESLNSAVVWVLDCCSRGSEPVLASVVLPTWTQLRSGGLEHGGRCFSKKCLTCSGSNLDVTFNHILNWKIDVAELNWLRHSICGKIYEVWFVNYMNRSIFDFYTCVISSLPSLPSPSPPSLLPPLPPLSPFQ